MCVGMCGHMCVGATAECALSWPPEPGTPGEVPALPLWPEKGHAT